MDWFRRLLGVAWPAEVDPDLDVALERAAARVEPRLPQASGWPRRYRVAIAAALAQARRVAEGIPGPLELSPGRYAGEPAVRALFASPEDIRRALCGSPALRDYVAAGGRREIYALLSMRRMEKTVLGVDMSGGALRREVPQTLMWFTDHRLSGPAEDEAGARRALLWTLFDRFLERLAVGVERLREERARLLREKDLAMARLRDADAGREAAAREALEEILRRLAEVTQALELERLAEVFDTVLSHPEDCLYLTEHTYALDEMGRLRGGDARATELRFVDLLERYQEPRTVLLAHCRDFTPVSVGERLREAEGWL
ncbi:MAG: hypothetical protein FJ209_04495 [Betaproteobacteria bacterium]|nr:hypothetical protein [Betaproteobacteria bacterium]